MDSSKEYLLADSSSDSCDSVYPTRPLQARTEPRSRRPLKACSWQTLLTILSLSVNIILLPAYFTTRSSPTAFASLSYDTSTQFKRDTDYTHPDHAISDAAWAAIDIAPGFVALDKQYADSMDLPASQAFPWDEDKSIYLLNAYHNLHCLKRSRKILNDLRTNQPVSGESFEHVLHCFDSLRQEIMCHADDTPLYSERSRPGLVGGSQHRMCRSWDQMQAWALQRSACWKGINPQEKIDELLRYRYCPPGSPYLHRIHQLFGQFDAGENASATT